MDESLFDQIHRTLQEAVERFTFKHPVLKQGEVDELVDNRVAFSIVGNHGLFLVLLFLYGLLGLCLLILILLSQFIVLLLILLLADGCQTSLLTFEF